ncbi:MAG: FtsX-like permease family protein [Gemmatimonadaceae bacterium]
MGSLELSIALRYLRSRRGSKSFSLISIIAIGGVLIGVAALIVVMGVMTGLQIDLTNKILVGSADIQVFSFAEDLRLPGWEAVLADAKKVKGVVKGAPFVQTQGLVQGKSGMKGAAILGIEPEGTPGADVTSIRSHAIMNDFRFRAPDGTRRGAVLGKVLAANLNAFPSDTIVLIGSLKMSQSTGQMVAHVDTFVVTGIFDSGLYEYDATYMYVDLKAAQQFAGIGDDVTGLELSVNDRWQSKIIATNIETATKTPVRAVDWQQQNKPLFQALKLEKLGMAIILLLIIVIAAFNIVSTLTMVVSDKTREIGILRTMGLSAKSVRQVFLWQGVLIGAIGTGLGMTLGLIVVAVMEKLKWPPLDPQVYFIDHVPVIVAPMDVIIVVVSSMAIATVATLYPAGQAARLFPVDAIRHE